MRRHWSMVYIVAAVILTVLFGLLGGLPLSVRWLLIMAVFIGLLVLIGRDVTGHEAEPTTRRGRASRAPRFVPGRADGVLIDLRHKVSLSRLQLVLWTVVVLSAWVTLALHRTLPVLQGQLLSSQAGLVDEVAGVLAGGQAGPGDVAQATAVLEQITGLDADDLTGDAARSSYSPLDIAFPQEVLLALGISVVSLAGAGLIKTNQAASEDGRATDIVESRVERASQAAAEARTEAAALESIRGDALEALNSGLESLDGEPVPPSPELQAQIDALNAQLRAAQESAARAEARVAELEAATVDSVGELHARPTFADARWSDMLRGDTIANYNFADLGKIQMFFFTIILVFTYAALVWSIMSMPEAERVLQLAPTLTLPAFSESLVLTLALSHGGYLATKTAA